MAQCPATALLLVLQEGGSHASSAREVHRISVRMWEQTIIQWGTFLVVKFRLSWSPGMVEVVFHPSSLNPYNFPPYSVANMSSNFRQDAIPLALNRLKSAQLIKTDLPLQGHSVTESLWQVIAR